MRKFSISDIMLNACFETISLKHSGFGNVRFFFMSKAYWEHYSHPADMGVRGFGKTKAEAFEQAALAMTAIVSELLKIELRDNIEICCEQDDEQMLFAGWLNAVIYEMATRKMLFGSFEVTIDGNRLKAKLAGEKINLKKHRPAVEVKAATFMDLEVKKTEDDLWMAQCIVDI